MSTLTNKGEVKNAYEMQKKILWYVPHAYTVATQGASDDLWAWLDKFIVLLFYL